MSSDAHVERCLSQVRELSDALAADLLQLSSKADAWDGPTNCPPWWVRDIAAHVVSSGEGFVASIRRGLAGSVEPPGNPEDRHRRQAQLESADPATIARELEVVTNDFVGLYDGLTEQQLSTICFHRRGNRSIRWYAAHRLAEVAFHSWDLQFSLGRAPRLDETVAALLLPTLLESNAPRTYAAGLTPERGRGERYGLAVMDDPAANWLVTIDPDALSAQRGGGPADLTITASAADLAMLVYGRTDLPTQSRTGAVHLNGNPALVDRFAQIFPRP
jgi:uncharacterized protein (TIGR03083 family)